MSQEDFMSYETSMNSTYDYLIDTCPRNVDDLKKIKIEWCKIRIVRFEKSDDCSLITMKYKVDFNDEYKEAVIGSIPPNTHLRKHTTTGLIVPLKYESELPVSKKLYDDLMFLCNKNAIPSQYHSFYSNLKVDDIEQMDDE